MMPPSVHSGAWTRRRWWLFVTLVFAAQLGFIFWLGAPPPPPAQRPARFPALQLAGVASAELLALSDPSLFALPHRQGFSGFAWLRPRPQPFPSFEWSEQPRWMPLSLPPPNAALQRVIETTNLALRSTLTRPTPEPTQPRSTPLSLGPVQSTLRLEGGLAGRRLLQPIELPPWRFKDLLTNTVVQAVVDAEGRPVSVPILLSGSGWSDADQYALQLVRTSRFDSVSRPGPGATPDSTAHLTWGRLVFVWHTLPLLSTNTPSSAPRSLP
jgi:hypothetical protein